MAGNVTVFDGANLFIRGDQANNQIEIVGDLDAGTITITGKQGTTINRSSAPLVISTSATSSATTGTSGTITVPSLTDGLRASLGDGNDSLVVSGVHFENDSIVFAGNGNDNVGFYKTVFGGDLYTQTFNGGDNVSIDSSSIGSDLFVLTLRGQDTAAVDQTSVGGKAFVVTGADDDRIGIRQSGASEDFLALSISGNDFVSINDTPRIKVFTGAGNDELSVVLTADANAEEVIASGQAGEDRIDFQLSEALTSNRPLKIFGVEATGISSLPSDIFDDLIISGARLGTITELARLTPTLSTLSGALTATGLDGALDGPGPLTAFAPLDAAFEKLPEGLLAGLGNEALADILRFHVSSGRLLAGDVVASDSIDTLLGTPFSVEVNSEGVLLNGNVTLAATNILAKNGVVHLLNEVLVPPVAA